MRVDIQLEVEEEMEIHTIPSAEVKPPYGYRKCPACGCLRFWHLKRDPIMENGKPHPLYNERTDRQSSVALVVCVDCHCLMMAQ